MICIINESVCELRRDSQYDLENTDHPVEDQVVLDISPLGPPIRGRGRTVQLIQGQARIADDAILC